MILKFIISGSYIGLTNTSHFHPHPHHHELSSIPNQLWFTTFEAPQALGRAKALKLLAELERGSSARELVDGTARNGEGHMAPGYGGCSGKHEQFDG